VKLLGAWNEDIHNHIVKPLALRENLPPPVPDANLRAVAIEAYEAKITGHLVKVKDKLDKLRCESSHDKLHGIQEDVMQAYQGMQQAFQSKEFAEISGPQAFGSYPLMDSCSGRSFVSTTDRSCSLVITDSNSTFAITDSDESYAERYSRNHVSNSFISGVGRR